MSESLRKAMDDLGAEALAGSCFEDETPDPEFRADDNREAAAPV
jgi:hypothetical protein